ncbi:hypothetical protein AKJ16_DCAP01678 [Drosera capensis]
MSLLICPRTALDLKAFGKAVLMPPPLHDDVPMLVTDWYVEELPIDKTLRLDMVVLEESAKAEICFD